MPSGESEGAPVICDLIERVCVHILRYFPQETNLGLKHSSQIVVLFQLSQ